MGRSGLGLGSTWLWEVSAAAAAIVVAHVPKTIRFGFKSLTLNDQANSVFKALWGVRDAAWQDENLASRGRINMQQDWLQTCKTKVGSLKSDGWR